MSDLKELLVEKGLPNDTISNILAYFNDARRAESSSQGSKPVTNSDTTQLYALAVKYWNMGVPLDGINAVITGKNMVMVTFNGYKNKILATYPETQFDIQLVREGDTFKFSKVDGQVKYHHELADPFKGGASGQITGAYVVIKNKRGEYLETLDKTTYEKMRGQSKQSTLWDKWESEFMLKSVIKRAAKRHFNDVVAEIDRDDNAQYGGVDVDEAIAKSDEAVDGAIATLETAKTTEDLRGLYMSLDLKIRNNSQVVAAKDRLKVSLDNITTNESTA